jgi:hypothetical protein
LGGGEPGEHVAQLARGNARQRLGLGVVGRPAGRHPVERLLLAAASVLVDDLVVGDGEDPGSELPFPAAEPFEVFPHREEHLVDEVVGRVPDLRPEVAEQREEQRS